MALTHPSKILGDLTAKAPCKSCQRNLFINSTPFIQPNRPIQLHCLSCALHSSSPTPSHARGASTHNTSNMRKLKRLDLHCLKWLVWVIMQKHDMTEMLAHCVLFLTWRKREFHKLLHMLQGLGEAQAAKGEQKAELSNTPCPVQGCLCFQQPNL